MESKVKKTDGRCARRRLRYGYILDHHHSRRGCPRCRTWRSQMIGDPAGHRVARHPAPRARARAYDTPGPARRRLLFPVTDSRCDGRAATDVRVNALVRRETTTHIFTLGRLAIHTCRRRRRNPSYRCGRSSLVSPPPCRATSSAVVLPRVLCGTPGKGSRGRNAR